MKKIVVLLFVFSILFASVGNADAAIVNQGLAMAYYYPEDVAALGVSTTWWYDWGSHGYGGLYVPMSWCGEDYANVSHSYSGYLLLFNEPQDPAMYPDWEQCRKSVLEGVANYMLLKALYPNAKFVVGNEIFWGSWNDWLIAFKQLCANQYPTCVMPTLWGIHVYIEAAPGTETAWESYVHTELEALRATLGGSFWMTEFADIKGNLVMDDKLTNLYKSHSFIKRWAYFTNRSLETDPWYLDGWRVDLFLWDGTPTSIGTWYIND